MAANAAPPVAARAATPAPIEAGAVADAAVGAVEGLPEAAGAVAQAAPLPTTAPSNSKSKTNSKSKASSGKKKAKEAAPRCVGYYLDALDKKMLWAEAKIIGCDVAKQKLRVHFIGWAKAHDIWTDTVSIAAHGRYAHKTKASGEMSWDGDMRLFEEMLGPIDDSTPCHDLDLADARTDAAVVLTNVAPPPPPTPSQRRAAKTKARPSSNGSLPTTAVSVARTPESKPVATRKRVKTKTAAAPRSRAKAVAGASTSQSKPAAAGSSTGEAIAGRKRAKWLPADPRRGPKKNRRPPSPSLPEVASVQAAASGEASDPLATLEARRRQLQEELELSVGFLDKCAGVFKRQLAELASS